LMEPSKTDIKSFIRDVPDFPKPGIIFKDITPLLIDPKAFASVIDTFAEHYRNRAITKVVGIEARGFLFAAPLALKLGAGLVIVRKPGKLPYHTCKTSYALEYGHDSVEMHIDAIASGDNVLLVDDVLATGASCPSPKASTINALLPSAFVDDYFPCHDGPQGCRALTPQSEGDSTTHRKNLQVTRRALGWAAEGWLDVGAPLDFCQAVAKAPLPCADRRGAGLTKALD